MTVYSYSQLEGLWINAGGDKSAAPTMAAIGEAESGGNSDSYNPRDTNGWPSAGIWQINDAGPAPAGWADPATNAQLAVAKYNASLRAKGNGFLPWGTYNSGAYKGYLSSKTSPDMNVPGSPTATTAAAAAAAGSDCLVGGQSILGLASLPCLFSRSNARAFIGAGFVLGGSVVGLAALAVLAVGAGMRAAGPLGSAAEGVGGAMMLVPGLEGAGAATAAAGRTARNPAREGRARARRREDEAVARHRAQGEPRENPDLQPRGGTARESGEQREARRRRERASARARARRSAGQGRPASREETGF